MLAAFPAPSFPMRALLLRLRRAWPSSSPREDHDPVRLPENLAYAPGVRARRMIRAARQGAC
jgi:hypothetical protein